MSLHLEAPSAGVQRRRKPFLHLDASEIGLSKAGSSTNLVSSTSSTTAERPAPGAEGSPPCFIHVGVSQDVLAAHKVALEIH